MSNIDVNKKHLAYAFLCPTNRVATMLENNCNEWELFQNPTWLLDHYFKSSGVELSEQEIKEITEFTKTRNGRQVTEAFLCPINRHCTRVKHGQSDKYFLIDGNYEYLIEHYIVAGGAAAFAKRREDVLYKEYSGKL